MPDWNKLRKELFDTMDKLSIKEWEYWLKNRKKIRKAAKIKQEKEMCDYLNKLSNNVS